MSMKEIFNKILLNLNIIAVSNININQLLTLIFIYCNTIHKQHFDYIIDLKDIDILQEKKMIRVISPGSYILRDLGKKIIELSINVKIEDKKPIEVYEEHKLEDLVDAIRDKFKGLKRGAMGDRKALIEKLTRWRINNPEITAEQILEAVVNYLDSQSNLTYIQRADYFIYKKSGQTETSRLSIWVDELKTPTENSDWASEIT